MSVYVVLVAAGRGERMGRLSGALGKAFMDIRGQTPLRACARAVEACASVDGFVAVVAHGAIAGAAEQLGDCGKLRAIVPGGDTRQKSVLCGLEALPGDCGIVLIHDAARAQAGPELFARCIDAVRRCGAAIPVIPVTDTVKVVEGERIRRTLDRASLVAVQTPQGFRYEDIVSAHRQARDEGFEATDDASLLERYGIPVSTFPGETSNFKITTPEDLERVRAWGRGDGPRQGGEEPAGGGPLGSAGAGAEDGPVGSTGEDDFPLGSADACTSGSTGEDDFPLGSTDACTSGSTGAGDFPLGSTDACADGVPLGSKDAYADGVPMGSADACAEDVPLGSTDAYADGVPSVPRIGQGFDAHRLVPRRRLVLCGVEIPYERGLLGHSDADVAVHALMDALLSAAGLGDIGMWFPDSEAEYKDADSMALLRTVMARLRERGYRLGNADVTIVAQRPKLGPYRDAMRESLAVAMGVSGEKLNVKFTTTEGMGWTGSGEGIAALSVAALYEKE